MSKWLVVWFSLVLSCFPTVSLASAPVTQIDLIFDASGSMWGQIDGKAKIDIARLAMKDLLREFATRPNIHLALRIYGHLNKKCTNSVLEVKMGPGNIDAIEKKIGAVQPLGKTPIAYSLAMCAADFNHDLPGEKVVILITDGLESCGGRPCKAALKLKKQGIVTRMHVVGFGMKEKELATLTCIAEPFGGKVIGANNVNELTAAFKEISRAVVVENNLRVLVVDIHKKPVVADVEIAKEGTSVASGHGSETSFSLEAGTYQIRAVSPTTGEALEQAVDITREATKEVVFVVKQGNIEVSAVNSKDESTFANYAFYPAGTEEAIRQHEGKGALTCPFLPGIYDVKALEPSTNTTVWTRGIEVKDGETVNAAFRFAVARLMLQGLDGAEKPIYTFFKVWKAGTKDLILEVAGEGVKEVPVPPGMYDLEAYEQETYNSLQMKNVEVTAGETTTKTFRFLTGTLIIEPQRADGSPSEEYWYYQLFRAGSSDKEQASPDGVGPKEKLFAPGTYVVKVVDGYDNEVASKTGVLIEAGKTTKIPITVPK